MSFGPWQLVIVAILILVLFGRGKISEMMGDFGKGISSFKRGMSEDEKASTPPPAQINGPSGAQHEAKPASEAAADPKPAADNSQPN